MGESPLTQNQSTQACQEAIEQIKQELDQATRVQTPGGVFEVQWSNEGKATAIGQLAFFAEFLQASGLFENWRSSCPLRYSSPNAPAVVDVLGTWMLDQSIIAGVGVTWASEIAAVAGVDVAAHMNVQNLSKLADAYVVVRDRVAAVYTAALPPPGDVDAACAAINAWYGNLYAVRAPVMTVHGVGVPVTVGGRNFWKPRVVS